MTTEADRSDAHLQAACQWLADHGINANRTPISARPTITDGMVTIAQYSDPLRLGEDDQPVVLTATVPLVRDLPPELDWWQTTGRPAAHTRVPDAQVSVDALTSAGVGAGVRTPSDALVGWLSPPVARLYDRAAELVAEHGPQGALRHLDQLVAPFTLAILTMTLSEVLVALVEEQGALRSRPLLACGADDGAVLGAEDDRG